MAIFILWGGISGTFSSKKFSGVNSENLEQGSRFSLVSYEVRTFGSLPISHILTIKIKIGRWPFLFYGVGYRDRTDDLLDHNQTL